MNKYLEKIAILDMIAGYSAAKEGDKLGGTISGAAGGAVGGITAARLLHRTSPQLAALGFTAGAIGGGYLSGAGYSKAKDILLKRNSGVEKKAYDTYGDFLDEQDYDRRRRVNDGNSLLRRLGYKPTLDETASGENEANHLSDMDSRTRQKPNQPVGKILLSALGGGLVAGIPGAVINPALGVATGTLGALGAGSLANRIFYTQELKDADARHQDEQKNALLDYLSKHHTAL